MQNLSGLSKPGGILLSLPAFSNRIGMHCAEPSHSIAGRSCQCEGIITTPRRNIGPMRATISFVDPFALPPDCLAWIGIIKSLRKWTGKAEFLGSKPAQRHVFGYSVKQRDYAGGVYKNPCPPQRQKVSLLHCTVTRTIDHDIDVGVPSGSANIIVAPDAGPSAAPAAAESPERCCCYRLWIRWLGSESAWLERALHAPG